MTKKEIKNIIKNYNSSLRVVDIDLIKNMDLLVARAVCISEFHMVYRISFYTDGTFSDESIHENWGESFGTRNEYKISDFNY